MYVGGVCWWCGVGEVVYVGGVEWVRWCMLVVWSGWGGVCWWCGVGEVVYACIRVGCG